ncbi:MAG TPA: hypothetical protein VFB81_23690 [Myxococcales bacterium]|nr:hypothetical protein [Myxococcales bacterium]
MKAWIALGCALAVLLCGCPAQQEVKRRAELRNVGGSIMQVVPTEGQLPYCLVFTISEGKVVRQLTMNRENKSVKCEAGQPIGGVSFRVPREEGKVKVLVFFSDRKINAGSLAQQVVELSAEGKNFYAYDLRLPGDVNTETLEFEPVEDVPTISGEAIGKSGAAADGGGGEAGDAGAAATPPPPAPAGGKDGGK